MPGAANIIAYNQIAGVAVVGTTSTGNAILSNAIFANDPKFGIPGLGIDLAAHSSASPDGVTPNDPGEDEDGDTGGNNLQNFPVVTILHTIMTNIIGIKMGFTFQWLRFIH